MPIIETLSERPEPIAPSTLGCAVLARFEREPDTLVIPVVENGRPVGLVERTAFLQKIAGRFGHALYDNRPISFAMDAEPAVVEGDTRIDAFSDIMLRGGPA
ncbi:MAG: response regulator receiver protein, partial [Brevundimonas mediterranea]